MTRAIIWLVAMAFLAALWALWPNDLPCECIVNFGGQLVGRPFGCTIYLLPTDAGRS